MAHYYNNTGAGGGASSGFRIQTVPGVTSYDFPQRSIPASAIGVSGGAAPTPSAVTPVANKPVPPDITVIVENTALSKYALSSAAAQTAQEVVAAAPFVINLAPDLHGRAIVPGSVEFTWGGKRYLDRLGIIYLNVDPATGVGVEAGTINYDTAIVTLTSYNSGDNQIEVHSLLTRLGRQFLHAATFRTPGAPLRPGSFSILGVASDGTQLSATAAFDGTISGSGIDGFIDVETGIVSLAFGRFETAAGTENEYWYNADLLEGDGTIWHPHYAVAESLYYTCVVYSYIPLDADLIGIDPVRLPSDGRVPIIKTGNVVVIHNTKTDGLPAGLSAGQEITLSRGNISAVRCYDANGLYVPTVHYSFNKSTQKLIMADPLDLSGFVQPLAANHRIEDMALVSDVQISGQVTLAAGLSHDYPVLGTWVSSALLFGDLQSRLYNMFDQKTWLGDWSDSLVGDACVANFNDVNFPPVITNAGGIKERWALVFDSSTHFQVIGEKVGVVADGYITNNLHPINPATTQPYFTLPLDGWGSGWSAGNVLRFNTDAANHDLWIARTTLSGPVTEPNDQFTIQIRGDAE